MALKSTTSGHSALLDTQEFGSANKSRPTPAISLNVWDRRLLPQDPHLVTSVLGLQRWKAFPYLLQGSSAPETQLASQSPIQSLRNAQILASEAVGLAWQRLAVHVLTVYKQRARPVRRGDQDAWVPRADLACGCLRLQPGTDYLLLGSAVGGPDPARLILDRHGLALPWRPRWAGPLRRLQQEERAGGCRGLRAPTPSPTQARALNVGWGRLKRQQNNLGATGS
ncbi:hypothetical protein P7K49_034764 [Saguinus oedipus]|uniref:NTR domain-containing protein n=1 Tax=Saguinus oedipus TaxID=9490 RepID=A0ABQ9TVN2_SAGOE|nr:hypothetical protein P7K49_034764 [Saguinus oedipus]